jgi:hypothetical protein
MKFGGSKNLGRPIELKVWIYEEWNGICVPLFHEWNKKKLHSLISRFYPKP